REGHGVAAPPIARVPRHEPLPLSFAQERLWFLSQLEPDDPTYAIPLAIRMEGALDVDALRRALAELVRRPEGLRTAYRTLQEQQVEVVRGEVAVDLPVTTVADEDALRRALAAEAARPFDLEAGAVLRARLFALREEEHVLVLAMHHIVSDA